MSGKITGFLTENKALTNKPPDSCPKSCPLPCPAFRARISPKSAISPSGETGQNTEMAAAMASGGSVAFNFSNAARNRPPPPPFGFPAEQPRVSWFAGHAFYLPRPHPSPVGTGEGPQAGCGLWGSKLFSWAGCRIFGVGAGHGVLKARATGPSWRDTVARAAWESRNSNTPPPIPPPIGQPTPVVRVRSSHSREAPFAVLSRGQQWMLGQRKQDGFQQPLR